MRKEARLFSTFTDNTKEVLYQESEVIKDSTKMLIPSGKTNLENMSYIYKTAIEKGKLEEAFKSLKAQSAPGIDGETKASFGKVLNKSIDKLNKDLRQHKYRPSPIKVIHILKPNGGKRPLGISSVRDKIVQAAFKIEVEKIYEPVFRKSSYGFRPKLSCHSAVKQIKKKWQAIKWLISLDILKCFDKIQHEFLIQLLKKRIPDQEFVDLM